MMDIEKAVYFVRLGMNLARFEDYLEYRYDQDKHQAGNDNIADGRAYAYCDCLEEFRKLVKAALSPTIIKFDE